MLESGNVVLVAHRRMFAAEEPRYFLGQVIEFADGLAKVGGYTFVRDVSSGTFGRKDDLRIKILSIASPGLIVYQLPDTTDVQATHFETIGSECYITDGKALRVNMSENLHHVAHV